MRIVSVSDNLLDIFANNDNEFMFKRGRPCIVLLKLTFRNVRRDFAVPFRSNIAPNTPKSQYFPLPPRSLTKPNHHHGIHYIKMFPIEKRFQIKFRTEGNPYYETIQNTLNTNEKTIVESCQNYLIDYECYDRPHYAVDLDRLIELLEQDNFLG